MDITGDLLDREHLHVDLPDIHLLRHAEIPSSSDRHRQVPLLLGSLWLFPEEHEIRVIRLKGALVSKALVPAIQLPHPLVREESADDRKPANFLQLQQRPSSGARNPARFVTNSFCFRMAIFQTMEEYLQTYTWNYFVTIFYLCACARVTC